MSNLFSRAASALARWTGLKSQPTLEESGPLLLDVPAASEGEASLLDMNVDPIADVALNPGEEPAGLELLPLGDPGNPMTATLDDMVGAAIAADAAMEISTEAPTEVVAEIPADPFTLSEAFGLVPDPDAVKVEPQAEPAVVAAAEAVVVEEGPKLAPEMKPEPVAGPAVPSFVEIYDLICSEVTHRTDATIAVYERLLAASRAELEQTRRNNSIAWSVGGVMTAVAAFGAIWATGEVSASRVELSAVRLQAATEQHASAEREQLRLDLAKIREATAKAEADTLKSRLDEALASSADRDRLRGELETARKAKAEVESELRIAKASYATTQPISRAARQAADAMVAERLTGNKPVSAAGSERPDVWSVLLNGGE